MSPSQRNTTRRPEPVEAPGLDAPPVAEPNDDGDPPVEYQPESGATGGRQAPSDAELDRDPRDDL